MNKIIRTYNQNRALFISIIIVVALIFIIIQVLNSIVKKQSDEAKKTINTNTQIEQNTISDETTSIITGEKVQNSETNLSIIKKFVERCNEGKIDEAYNMLSQVCKSTLYPSLERFKTVYYDRIFNIERMYTLKNWYSSADFDTYKITYTEDVLATGNVESKNNIGDYITVDRSGSTSLLNINSFVGIENINKSNVNNGVTIVVDKMYKYIDYTIVNFKIKNNTKNSICIDTKEDIENVYLYDTNNIKYLAFLNEIADNELKVLAGGEITLNIKFNKIYNPKSRELKGIAFKDVVLNYENYTKGTEEKNKIIIDINI